MKVENVIVFPSKHPMFVANGYFTLDEKFKVKYTLVKGKKGLFLSFPSDKVEKKLDDGSTETKYYPHFDIVDDAARKEITQTVIAAFAKKTGAQPPAPEPEDQTVDQSGNENLVPF